MRQTAARGRAAIDEKAAEIFKSKITVCMFDQCGTEVDMQTGLTEVVTPYFGAACRTSIGSPGGYLPEAVLARG